MNVKIDTKEKFSVITPNEPALSANMTDDLINLLLDYTNKSIPHIVLNMEKVEQMSSEDIFQLTAVYEKFYNNNFSFVICGLNKKLQALLKDSVSGDALNLAPTKSEAGDIIQMEEIERELLNDPGFNEVP